MCGATSMFTGKLKNYDVIHIKLGDSPSYTLNSTHICTHLNLILFLHRFLYTRDMHLQHS